MKTLFALCAVLPVVLCFAGAGTAAESNCIENASFENIAEGRRGRIRPEGWRPQTWNGRALYSCEETGRTGKRCVSISSTDGADASWIHMQEVIPFSTYKLTCWIKTENLVPTSGRGALVSLQGMRDMCTAAVTGSTDWTQVEMHFDTKANDSVQINLMLGYYGQATGKAWFDDLSCVLLSTREMKPEAVIDAGNTGEPISPYIYGQFIEHLGRCIYGGIWAEMLQDRKFFYAVDDRRSPWDALGDAGQVTMSKEKPYVGEQDPVIIVKEKGKTTGIVQKNLGVEKGKTYTGRIILKGDAMAAPVIVTLAWGSGEKDRQAVVIDKLSDDYATISLSFTAGAETDEAQLEITAKNPGSIRIGTLSLMPDDNIQGFRKDTLALLRELDSPVYRWPGGNFVSGYDWKDGIGPRDRRPPRKNPAWRGVEHNDVGIHEFIDLCRLLDTDPNIAVNTGLGSVESTAEEVEYVNGPADSPMGKLRVKNGSKEPFKVKWWCVGNEMFGGWQLGHMPLEEYVKKHNAVAKAMWAKDPSIQLIAVGAVGRWDELMLKHCADYMNYISEHFYCQQRPGVFGHTRLIPDAIKRICDAHRRYRETIPELKGKDIRIAMDEWNYWYGPHVYGELGTRYFLKDALGIAAGLHEYFRNSDIVYMANYAQTVNVIGCIKTSKTKAAFATTGLILKMYRHHYGTIPVAVSGDSMPLDVAAALTEDKKTLTIAMVNPMSEPVTFPLEIKGVELKGSGKLWCVAGTDPMAYNEPGNEPKVEIKETLITSWDKKLTVPALSASLYALELK